MRIEAQVSLVNVTPSVKVQHLGQELTFSISFYRRTIFSGETFDIFSQINAYWEDQTTERQQAIFEVYRRVFNSFEDIHNKLELRAYLQTQVIELFSYHNLDTVQEWIAFRSTDIKLPASIPSEFVVDVDRNTSIGKTYIAADYRRLTALSLVLRTMIPIWGEYIYSIKTETDDNFKEMQAFQLVDKVLTSEVPAVAKLMNYIENTINSANLSRPTGVFKGISTSDYPRWLLSLVCIRCLAVGDIRGTNENAHLVTFIHMFISNRLSTKDEGGDNKIKDKELDDSMEENQARASALERYKVKANISTGDIVELEFFLQDAERVCYHLAPGIPMQDVFNAMTRLKDYEGKPTIPQVNLLRWIISPVAPPGIIHYLSEPMVKDLMGIMEAVLWYRHHEYLSILSTCQPIRSEKEMVVSPVDSKMRIPEELIAQLNLHFPYSKNQKNKKQNAKETNLSMESIDIMTNNFMMYGWRPTTDSSRVEKLLGYKTTRFPIKPDIKTDLARLVLEIETLYYRPKKPDLKSEINQLLETIDHQPLNV